MVIFIYYLLFFICIDSSLSLSYNISNEYYSLEVNVDDTNNLIYVSSLSLNRAISGFSGWSPNILYNAKDEYSSGTGILLSSNEWIKPTCGEAPSVTSISLSFKNISSAYTQESWDLFIEDGNLEWTVTTTFTNDVTVNAIQFPVFFFNTAVAIPGFLDNAVFMNESSNAGFQLDSIYYEFLSPNLFQDIRLAPFNLRFISSISGTGFFTFGKAAYDGTSPFVSLGLQPVDRRHGPQTFKKGTSFTTTWSLRVIPDLGFPFGDTDNGPEDLILSIPGDIEVEQLSKRLFLLLYIFLGFTFGNNPASVICLHEMGFFPMIQGILASNPESVTAIQTELEFLLSKGVNGSGYVMPRWNSAGFFYVRWGPLHDQIPHAILAVYYHVMKTGDKSWLTKMLPSVELIANYLISLDGDGDGVPEVPGSSGLSDGGQHASNWYDIIEFGHKDAIVSTYSVMALQALADMYNWLGNATQSDYYNKLHSMWVQGFNNVFWDQEKGYYCDWVDINDNKHAYFYVDQNLLAIIFGIASKDQAQSIITAMDANYNNISAAYKVPREKIWATPANLIPISTPGDMMYNGTLQNQTYYPNYENGGSFFHSPGYEVAARAVAGDPDGAYEVYRNTLIMGQDIEPGFMWSALLKWDTQTLYGEPLTGAILSTWGFIRGCFGVWPSLSNGLQYTGTHAAALEGASTTFQFLGMQRTIFVNKSVFIN